jgi:hypothetical protein
MVLSTGYVFYIVLIYVNKIKLPYALPFIGDLMAALTEGRTDLRKVGSTNEAEKFFLFFLLANLLLIWYN